MAEEFVFDQEFVTVVNKESRLKMRNKYKSWFNGFTILELSYFMVKENFFIKTTEDKGEIISPDYGLYYDDKNFTMKMFTCIFVYPPHSMKDTSNLKFRLEAEIDTKKTIMSGIDYVFLTYNKRKNTHYGSQNISRTFPVQKNSSKIQIKFCHRRDFTSIKEWTQKRNTGFKIRWYYTDNFGNTVNLKSDKHRANAKNKNFIEFVKIISKLNIEQKQELIKIIKGTRRELMQTSVGVNFCNNGMLVDFKVEKAMQHIQNYFNKSLETIDLISDATIEEAGPIFTWMIKCPDNAYINAWNKFYNNLFDFNLRTILIVLFKIKNIAELKQKVCDPSISNLKYS